MEQAKKIDDFGNHRIVRPGDIVWTWCSRHQDRTDHVYTGHKLICIECHPEQDPRKETDERPG